MIDVKIHIVYNAISATYAFSSLTFEELKDAFLASPHIVWHAMVMSLTPVRVDEVRNIMTDVMTTILPRFRIH